MNTIELHELAKKIAPLIGYEYDEKASRNYDGDLMLPHLSSANGQIYFGDINYGHAKGRLHISVSWPTGRNRQNFFVSQSRRNGRKPDITVAGTKSVEQIAKDIKNRLLPDAESLWQEAARDMNSANEYQDGKIAAMKKVAALLGKSTDERDFSRDSQSWYINNNNKRYDRVIVHSASSIKVEIDANVDNIEKIIEFAKSLEAK